MVVENPVDQFLAAITGATIGDADCWAAGAVVDATVPNWRFALEGADAIRAEYRRWFADPGTFETLRRVPLPDGELVEYVLRWEEAGVPHAAHHMHRLEVADGKIVSDTAMCGGRWDQDLLDQMSGG